MEFQFLLPAGTPSHKGVISLDLPFLALEVEYMYSLRGQKKRKRPLFKNAVEPAKMTSSLHSGNGGDGDKVMEQTQWFWALCPNLTHFLLLFPTSRTHFCVFHFESSFFLITSMGKPLLLKFKLTEFWILLFSFLPCIDQRLNSLNTIMILIRHKWASIFLLCHHPLKCIILLDASLWITWITSDFYCFHEPNGHVCLIWLHLTPLSFNNFILLASVIPETLGFLLFH